MYTSTHNADVSLAQEFQKQLSNASLKNVLLDDGKHNNFLTKQNCTDREYHVFISTL